MIEQHLHVMFDQSSLPDGDPIALDSPPNDTPQKAIADLILCHLNHPVNVLAQGAQRACANLLLQRHDVIQDAVRESLSQTEDYQAPLLMVLDAVSLQSTAAVAPFRNPILNLRESPNYWIRRITQAICRRLGYGQTPILPRSIPLPSIYRFALPPTSERQVVIPEEVLAGNPFPDSDDPIERVSPFDRILEFVAEEAELETVNLCYRAVQIMRTFAQEESWSAAGERHLQDTLHSAGLDITYRRPRAMLAHRAMFHVIAELIDAGILGPANLRRLELPVRFYDPALLLVDPAPRHSEVGAIVGKGQYGGVIDEWIEKINAVEELVTFQTPDEHVILAEDTTLKLLDRGEPMEVRRSVILTPTEPDPNVKDEPDPFFKKVVNLLLSDYPTFQVYADNPSLILHNAPFCYDSPGGNWLALTPAVGYQFGWILAEDGPFRWLNEKGETMVESIWWKDGCVERFSHHPREEVGEGWLVVATQAAWNALKTKWTSLKRRIYVERSFYRDGQMLRRQMDSERPITE